MRIQRRPNNGGLLSQIDPRVEKKTKTRRQYLEYCSHRGLAQKINNKKAHSPHKPTDQQLKQKFPQHETIANIKISSSSQQCDPKPFEQPERSEDDSFHVELRSGQIDLPVEDREFGEVITKDQLLCLYECLEGVGHAAAQVECQGISGCIRL